MGRNIEEVTGDISSSGADGCLNFQANDVSGGGGVHPKNIPLSFNWKFYTQKKVNNGITLTHAMLNLSDICLGPVELNNYQATSTQGAKYSWYLAIMHAEKVMKEYLPDGTIDSISDSYTFSRPDEQGNHPTTFHLNPWVKSWTIDLGDIKGLVPYLNSSGHLTLYVGGCSTYDITSSDYATSIPITFESTPSIGDLLKYYPFAIKKSIGWFSCNRFTDNDKGYVKILTDGRDVKNSEVYDDELNNKAFIYIGTSNKLKAPKIGTGAE